MYFIENDDDEQTVMSTAVAESVKSESGLTIYLSTSEINESRTSSAVRTLYQPPSWPSVANLAKDSDIYPPEPLSRHRIESDIISDISVYRSLDERVQQVASTIYPVDKDGYSAETTHYSQYSSSLSSCVKKCGPICLCLSENETIVPSTAETLMSGKELAMAEFDLALLNDIIELPIDRRSLSRISFGETLIISCSRETTDKYDDARFAQNTAGSVYPQMIEMNDIDEVGGMCISVQQSAENLITYCTSQFSFENNGASSSLISVVNRELRLIEEKKTETLHKDNDKEEKSLHVFQELDHHIAFRTSIHGKHTKRYRGQVQINVQGNFLLDGGGYILMRYLIVKKFTGDLEVWSMHIGGELCRCIFSVGKRKLMMIQNRPYEAIRIVRIVFRTDRKPDISKTYFLPSGHIVRHRWVGCRYFMHLNPMGKIPPCNYFVSLERNWENDIQLMSTYLDYKQQRQSEIKSYLDDNREVKSMIKDYMLCLLQNKPNNVLDFTIDYFQNLLSED